MIKFLFNLLCTIVIFQAILMVIIGGAYILNVELKELLEVDVLFNLKRKVRNYIYAEKKDKKTKRLRYRRPKRNQKNTFRSNLQRLSLQKWKPLKKAIRERSQETAE